MSKLLIWSKNTYKQKKKPEWEGMIGTGSKKEKGEEIPAPLRSIF
jgi:hypothetical protein